MDRTMVMQGRCVSRDDLSLIQTLLAENPSWSRTRLSRELCELWNWRNTRGRLKDMACRTLLLKLARAGHIMLPPAHHGGNNHLRYRRIRAVPHAKAPIESTLCELLPLELVLANDPRPRALFATFLSEYHYLGYTGPVGENVKYLVFDNRGRPLACLLFGSAAWRVAPRDTFIGWDDSTRRRHLHLITNNMRFLILPWVRVPHLASHLLSRTARRVSGDWTEKYGHPIHLLETFVERDRFRGICYQAANWFHVGQTTGRTRNDPDGISRAPIKDVYVFPLTRGFREELSRDA